MYAVLDSCQWLFVWSNELRNCAALTCRQVLFCLQTTIDSCCIMQHFAWTYHSYGVLKPQRAQTAPWEHTRHVIKAWWDFPAAWVPKNMTHVHLSVPVPSMYICIMYVCIYIYIIIYNHINIEIFTLMNGSNVIFVVPGVCIIDYDKSRTGFEAMFDSFI